MISLESERNFNSLSKFIMAVALFWGDSSKATIFKYSNNHSFKCVCVFAARSVLAVVSKTLNAREVPYRIYQLLEGKRLVEDHVEVGPFHEPRSAGHTDNGDPVTG